LTGTEEENTSEIPGLTKAVDDAAILVADRAKRILCVSQKKLKGEGN
jgi:hypothetical protein